jgi:alcohol dehydrogenase
MKAAQIKSFGKNDAIEVVTDAPVPTLKAGQVLVNVDAASLNPFDLKLREGLMPLPLPLTLGGDFVGEISVVGEGVTAFKVGDEVYGAAVIVNGGSGSLAEQVASNTKDTARKPKKATTEEAAALPLVGSSAVQALEEHMKLKADQKVLIHGGAGGIGHIAIQVAKALGAYVATTVSTDDIDFVRNLGADEIIDYKTQKFEEVLKDFDGVYDTVGGETTTKSFNVLKKGGVLVSMLGQPDEELAKQHGVTAIGQMTKTSTEHLTRIAQLVDADKVKVRIAQVFPLEQAKAAFMAQEEHPQGKIVVTINE